MKQFMLIDFFLDWIESLPEIFEDVPDSRVFSFFLYSAVAPRRTQKKAEQMSWHQTWLLHVLNDALLAQCGQESQSFYNYVLKSEKMISLRNDKISTLIFIRWNKLW